MALPYVLAVTCIAIDPWPAVSEVAAASSYAIVTFRKADAETAADQIQTPVVGVEGPFKVRIHQAQKDDFTIGTDYNISINV